MFSIIMESHHNLAGNIVYVGVMVGRVLVEVPYLWWFLRRMSVCQGAEELIMVFVVLTQ